ncbi:NAD(P)H-dependent oxidoreductase [Vagococcus fluvialis]|uniref:NAD(P)H-dependent oxidoreductase n=1 Tax=Vagococcus fluvialis TaxID=2738 RepID=A0A7X6DAV7_9ENTE|nr:NAD(P)H-dependent oxidoreductase [Vagococcus fluvialis]NKC69000.1 NAD(P)H-dependent oxidoreductase [Vagococcus fluvialis]
MKTLIVLAHPEYEDSNTQQFLIASTKNLEDVRVRYLDEEKIDKIKEKEFLKEVDRIIFQFPMYWYSAPFLLKRWLDEVFDDSLIANGLKNKELGLVVTMGLSQEDFAAGRSEKFTLSEIFRPFEALANKCQMTYLPIFPVALFPYLSEVNKKKLLIDYQMYLTKQNETSFKKKEDWFVSRLESFKEKSTNQESINHVLESLKDNRETLDDLLVLVKEMRLEGE